MRMGMTEKRFIQELIQAPAPRRARFALIALFVLGGCGYRDFHVTPGEQAHIARAGLVSVIGRFTIEGEWQGEAWQDWIRPRLAKIATGDDIMYRQPGTGGMTAPGNFYRGDAGWYRVLLEPGTYVMGLAPFGNHEPRTYRFVVPRGAREVYVGSYTFKCRGRKRGFMRYPLACEDKVAVADEKKAAARHLQTAPALLKSLRVRPYGEMPTLARAMDARRARIQLKKPPFMGGPDWRKKPPFVEEPNWDRFDFTERVDEPGAGSTAAGILVEGMSSAPEFWILASPVIVPMVLARGLEIGKNAQTWSPCVAKLDARVRDADLEGVFRRRFRHHAGTAKDAGLGAGGNRYVLEAEVRRIKLRKCTQAKTYCVEVAVRTRLWVGGRTAYDKVHVYSRRGGGDKRLTHGRYRAGTGNDHYWEIPVEPASPCRDIGAYCGAEGQARAMEEIETALDAVAAAVARDLSGAPGV